MQVLYKQICQRRSSPVPNGRECGYAYAKPIEKIKHRRSFFFVCSCKCHITGTGIRKIQMSVMRFEMLVKYVKVTRCRQSPLTLLSQNASMGRQTRAKVTVMPIPHAMMNAAVANTTFRNRGTTKTR